MGRIKFAESDSESNDYSSESTHYLELVKETDYSLTSFSIASLNSEKRQNNNNNKKVSFLFEVKQPNNYKISDASATSKIGTEKNRARKAFQTPSPIHSRKFNTVSDFFL
jgi:hypothetical protein